MASCFVLTIYAIRKKDRRVCNLNNNNRRRNERSAPNSNTSGEVGAGRAAQADEEDKRERSAPPVLPTPYLRGGPAQLLPVPHRSPLTFASSLIQLSCRSFFTDRRALSTRRLSASLPEASGDDGRPRRISRGHIRTNVPPHRQPADGSGFRFSCRETENVVKDSRENSEATCAPSPISWPSVRVEDETTCGQAVG
ncbi:hypothetical protein Bbelb_290260 [Branchiostoma belcheri]|nr:hypothetical protein Bbelb_290260 [Branchiostoma belcheri]